MGRKNSTLLLWEIGKYHDSQPPSTFTHIEILNGFNMTYLVAFGQR